MIFLGSSLIQPLSLIVRFIGPTWGPSWADRTQMGPMLAPWTLLSGVFFINNFCLIIHANKGVSLQWYHKELDGISSQQRLHCLFNCWFRSRSKKTAKLYVTGFCEGNSPVTGEFPTQQASNVENVSIWWCHHVYIHPVCMGLRFFVFIRILLILDWSQFMTHISLNLRYTNC